MVDVNLPGISGLELLELLRNDPHWDEPLVLLMSAQPDQIGIVAALQAGRVTTFLRKPFDIDKLVSTVHRSLSGA